MHQKKGKKGEERDYGLSERVKKRISLYACPESKKKETQTLGFWLSKPAVPIEKFSQSVPPELKALISKKTGFFVQEIYPIPEGFRCAYKRTEKSKKMQYADIKVCIRDGTVTSYTFNGKRYINSHKLIIRLSKGEPIDKGDLDTMTAWVAERRDRWNELAAGDAMNEYVAIPCPPEATESQKKALLRALVDAGFSDAYSKGGEVWITIKEVVA